MGIEKCLLFERIEREKTPKNRLNKTKEKGGKITI